MYVPSLPYITNYFHTNPTNVKLTISIYFLSFAIMPLIYGPLSDRYGRRGIVLLGMILFFGGSIVCAFSFSVNELTLGRFCQGAGTGAIVSLNRSIARDVFSGRRLSQIASYISMVFGIMPAIAPIAGSYFQGYFGWRSVFIFMVVYSIVAFLIIWLFLPETNKALNIHAIEFMQVVKIYGLLFSNRIFMSNTIAMSAAISGILAYYTITPFLFQNVLHVDAVQYGWLTVLIAAGLLVGKGLNILLMRKHSPGLVLVQGNVVMFISALLMLLLGLIGIRTIAATVAPMIIFVIGTGLVISNSFTGAIMPFKKIAGSAGSLYSFLQTIAIFVITYIAAHLESHSQLPLATLLTALSGAALFDYAVMLRSNPVDIYE